MIKATLFLCIITFTVYFIDTWAQSLTLAIYKNKQYNLTGSVFKIISLASKFALVFQAPLLGMLIDVNINNGENPINDFRTILFFSTVGIVFSLIFLPSFLKIFTALVSRVAHKGSLFKVITEDISINKLNTLQEYVIAPKIGMAPAFKEFWKYKWLFLINTLVASIHAVGVLSSYYGAMSMPAARLSIAGFSGSINSIASLAMILVLDPKIALITDETYKGNYEYNDLKIVVIILTISKLIGTLLSQALLIPASEWVVWVYKFLVY